MSTEPKKDDLKCAVHLFLIKDGKILIEKRKNREYCDNQYDVIATHLKDGEELLNAVIRAAKNETNIIVKKEDLKFIQVMHQKSEPNDYINYFFITDKYYGELNNNEPQYCDGIEWVEFKYPIDNMMDYINEAIKNFLDDPTNINTEYGFNKGRSL